MTSEFVGKRLSLMSFSEFDIKLAMRMAVASVVLLLCGTVRAETDLDDVTMRVIGLDEIPTHSLQIIELPQSDLGELSDINESLVTPQMLVAMLSLVEKGTISGRIAKTVFEEMYRTGKTADEVVEEKGLVQISDASGIETIIDEVLNNSTGEVARFREGETKLMGFFVGQVMKATKGKANPKIVNELLRKKLH